MSRGVDVSAVMGLALRNLNGGSDSLTAKEHFEAFEGMKEACAAFEQLIAAGQEMQDAFAALESGSGRTDRSEQRWYDARIAHAEAIARARGAA